MMSLPSCMVQGRLQYVMARDQAMLERSPKKPNRPSSQEQPPLDGWESMETLDLTVLHKHVEANIVKYKCR